MKISELRPIAALFLAPILLLAAKVNSQDKKGEAVATVEFAKLEAIEAGGKCRLGIVLKASDGSILKLPATFTPAPGVGESVCLAVEGALKEAGWETRQTGSRLSIVSFKGAKGTFPIAEIHLTSENTFPIEFVPTIETVGKVVTKRCTDPSP